MDKKIIEASELPNDEKVYLKKDFLGWRIVHPIKNEDGSWNWPNLLFGGWRNLLSSAILILIIAGAIWAYRRDINQIKQACDIAKAFQIKIYP